MRYPSNCSETTDYRMITRGTGSFLIRANMAKLSGTKKQLRLAGWSGRKPSRVLFLSQALYYWSI